MSQDEMRLECLRLAREHARGSGAWTDSQAVLRTAEEFYRFVRGMACLSPSAVNEAARRWGGDPHRNWDGE